MEEKVIVVFLGDKKMKWRIRLFLGGSEEFIKGFLEFNGVVLVVEERKFFGIILFWGECESYI